MEAVQAHLAAREGQLTEPGERMSGAVTLANLKVWNAATADPERSGMGTTVTALVIHPDSKRWTIGHVGDSRGYMLHDGTLTRITRDRHGGARPRGVGSDLTVRV